MDEEGTLTSGVKVSIDGVDPLALLGQRDQNLRAIEDHYSVSMVIRNGEARLFGAPESVTEAASFLQRIVAHARSGQPLSETDVQDFLAGRRNATPSAAGAAELTLEFDRKTIRSRSDNQSTYLRAIVENDIVFGIGPAGTGKTYLAVAMAVHFLRKREIDRVVLARPAVEAGEKLGYLPGDLQEKIDPYLRPLYDALEDMITHDRLQKFLQTNVIEIVPLAFMRGRTLSRSFIILDEAQNTTLRQMKMFLTRLGLGSHAVVTGDVTQIDLVDPADSGLVRIQPILEGVPGVEFVRFTHTDVVRHRLVKDILQAFDRAGGQGGNG
jgi:phosphate starvation-inducible PhoH-like protein